VAVWLVGHRHRNVVRAVPHPEGTGPGFWEITSSSMIDWPNQARLVEIIRGADGSIGARCTMIDHDALDTSADDPDVRLAALHRELACNMNRVIDEVIAPVNRAGTPLDRNVVLARSPH
jgi:hypothetical protein